MSAELHHLNDPQRRAAVCLDGPCLVLAGAGSGKTRVITSKIKYLIESCGYKPAHIAAITFTNKAAQEMQERVAHLMGKKPRDLIIATFHALGLRILREECGLLGLKPRFSIVDSSDAFGILQELLSTTDKALIQQIQWRVSSWKNAFISPDEALSLYPDELQTVLTYRNYQATLQAYQAVDFDDLIMCPVTLLTQYPEALSRWQGRLRYLLVDEYQDTNAAQYRLLRLLAGPRGMFTVVGDDDQAIYAWRGADIENLRHLQRDFPTLQVIKLEQNYRSTIRILKTANALIAHNPKLFEKRLWSELGMGEQIQVSIFPDEEQEAESIAMKILAHRFDRGGQLSDYAILYRSNHQARVFEQQLRARRMPYRLSGGQSFFDKAEIKDICAYLRLIANQDDDPAFIRAITTPKRGVGASTLESLGRYAAARKISLFTGVYESGIELVLPERQLLPVREFCDFINRMSYRAEREPADRLLDELLQAIGYETYLFDQFDPRPAESKLANVRELQKWCVRKADEDNKTLLEATQTLALRSLLEGRDDQQSDEVQLTTLHAAKGLEFKYVFLTGCEEGILPHRESIEQESIEEERRLMYVGITRAQRALFISYCQRRRRGGEWVVCEPSRFIAEMGEDNFKLQGQSNDLPSKETSTQKLAHLKGLLNKA